MLLACLNSENAMIMNNAYYRLKPVPKRHEAQISSDYRRACYSHALFQVLVILCIISTCTTLILCLLTRAEVNNEFKNLMIQHQIDEMENKYDVPASATVTLTDIAMESQYLRNFSQFLDRQEHVKNHCSNCGKNKTSNCFNTSLSNSFAKPAMRLMDLLHLSKSKSWIHINPKTSSNDNTRRSISWCPIFKAASTPWMAMVGKLSNILTPHTEERIRSGKLTFVKLFKDFRLNIPPPDRRNTSLKMIVVRHPFERLLSAYRDKLERVKGREFYHKKYGFKIVERFRNANQFANYSQKGLSPSQRFHSALSSILDSRKLAESRFNSFIDHVNTPSIPMLYTPPTFPEFVQYLLRSDPHLMDEHWKPMYLDCSPCNTPFDLILKVETMSEDRAAVLELLGYGNSELTPELNEVWSKWTNEAQSHSHKNKTLHYFSQIKKAELKSLYNIYEPDFLLFNYEANSYFNIAI